jgi:hypothetical protein
MDARNGRQAMFFERLFNVAQQKIQVDVVLFLGFDLYALASGEVSL